MNPKVDFHAFAPELVLAATIVLVLLVDLASERGRMLAPRIATVGVLAAFIPVITLALDDADRSMFGGAYVVDNYALALKAFFLAATYITLLLSIDYIHEGDYYEGEFYFLLLISLFGMSVMASSRDLISIFIALETISIPTYVLATWRKHDATSNEAGVKYYVFGVLSSAVMLFGMSYVFGTSGSTLLSDIAAFAATDGIPALFAVGIFFALAGFAFKVSAVPFHFWAPDTYEGAPTPVTAFLSVASKAGGFVALLTIVYFGFFPSSDSWQPILWVFAAATMTLGNLTALRQTNIIRLLAYSSIAQGGFILTALAVAGDGAAQSAFEAVVVYLLIYGAMNLGAFAVVIAAARRTHSAEISSFAGMGTTAPALAVVMTMFLFSLAGIPPLAGWFAKFVVFRAVLDAGTPSAIVLGVIAAVNAVIAFFYYAGVAREMWFRVPSGEVNTVKMPVALGAALALTTAVVIAIGVYPQVFARIGEAAFGG